MKSLFFIVIFVLSSLRGENKKVLHLSFHKGCIEEIEHVFEHLSGYSLTNFYVYDFPKGSFDGKSTDSSIYNIGHDRAENIWNIHKEYFKEFDIILTSDTTPLARIFLQNGWEKPLIIWVCNRIDYTDRNHLDCDFPDNEYYELLREATKANNVTFASFMPIDRHHAKTRGIDIGPLIILPCGFVGDLPKESAIPSYINRKETFFVPPYHNEKNFMNLSNDLDRLGIPNWHGRYNGPSDMHSFKGIICLPYSWATLALYENFALGNIYFIPSKKFFLELMIMPNYYYPDTWMLKDQNLIHLSEWYNPMYKDLFVYFDSWKDLRRKIMSTDYNSYHERIRAYHKAHKALMIERWQTTFDNIVV